MTLTEHQQEVFNNITTDMGLALANNKRFIASIQGPAGTGKTVMTSELLKYLLQKYVFKKLKVCTPTHKALKVVNNMIPQLVKENKNFSSGTIHSYLKLKKSTIEDKVIFVEDLFSKGKNQEELINILLIDESSMISEDIFNKIKSRASRDNIDIVLFVGDEMQLSPVDSDDNVSPVFNNITQYYLTEVVRQAEDDPILHKATELRLRIENNDYKRIQFTPEHSIIVYDDTKTWLHSFIDNPNRDEALITAFTNKSVNQYNNYIRNVINNSNGVKLPKLIHDEYIVLQEAYEDSKKGMISNGEVIKVCTPILRRDNVNKVDYWSFHYTDEEMLKSVEVNILDDNSLDAFNEALQKIANEANAFKKAGNYKESGKSWGKFWKLKAKYVDIKYAYAYTIHKTQGTTVQEIYINLKDISNNVCNQELLHRLLYVAVTRAKTKVHVLQ